MAWWVKNHIAVNDNETRQLCSIESDTQTSLPAADQTATVGFIIVRGSDALVLDTGDRYIMNSAGTWIRQPSGVQLDLTGYATTQDLADGLAGKVDTTTYTAGQAAQDAVISTKISSADVWGLGTALSANTDLDTITTVGRYICSGAGIGSTLINCPTIQPFVLAVSAFQATDNRIQRIESLNLSTFDVEIFERMKISSGWKSWTKFVGVQV